MSGITSFVSERLTAMRDDKYRDFQIKLVPNVDPSRIIGVRTPDIRALAKQISVMKERDEYLSVLPHEYFDENNLHGILIDTIKDFDAEVAALDAFLPYVDNWATCDIISPKRLAKNPDKLIKTLPKWIKSDHTYTIRFGIEVLMSFYLDDRFNASYLDMVADIRSDEYYVDMMVAWFFATALAKQYEPALSVLQSRKLAESTHNRTIQKAVESLRITDEQKAYLRSLRIKKSKG